MSILISLIASPFGKADTPATNSLDESKPIMSYCQPEMYACEGFVPASPEQYLPPWTPGFRNYQGLYHNDVAGIYRFPSYALSLKREGGDYTGQATAALLCNDIAASNCDGDEINYSAILPMCDSGISIDCFRDIVVTDGSNKNLAFTVEGEFPKNSPSAFKGSPALKVPNGSAPTLIHVPGAPHAGGDTYLIKIEQSGMKQKKYSADFGFRNLYISVTAVKIQDGKFSYGGVSSTAAQYLPMFSVVGSENGTYPSYCAIASTTQCAARYSIPAGLHFGMTVDLSNKITGWLHGRVKAPSVEVKNNSAGGTTLTVLAEAIKVPINAAWVNNNSAPQSVKDFYIGKPNYGSIVFGSQNRSGPLSEIALIRDGNSSHNQETLNEYLAWLPALGDKAQALQSAWVIQTMNNYQQSDQIQNCLRQTDALAGIVTSNAAEYLDGPPVYDKASRALDYKVAATHFEPDGTTVYRGSYDLVMSSKVARCIYGFTSAPVTATISVTSDAGGNSAIVTTIFGEKNGWLSLGAYNFTYSSPTIRIVLDGTIDQPVVVPTPTPEPVVQPSANPVVKPTVAPKKPVVVKTTCVKGKLTKVVTGTKCPAGYKKK